MKELGGYIEFEYYRKPLLHERAVKLNCGRNALAYLIQTKQISRIALPYFLCDSIRNVCKKYSVAVRGYSITEQLTPVDMTLDDDEWLYIVNYYGQLSPDAIRHLSERYSRIIVDNAQAYFAMPVSGVDTLYTCRKFFGVADGAILYTDAEPILSLEQDKSFERMTFLLGRMECGSSPFYAQYAQNNASFAEAPIRRMSKLTENLLRGIDYEFVKKRRTDNFKYLAERLGAYNQISVKAVEGAFAYPLLLDDGLRIRQKLIDNKIYIPLLWPNVLQDTSVESLEYKLASCILPIPCDQRYGQEELDEIIHMVQSFQ